MASFKVGKGADAYLSELEKLGGATSEIVGKAIYEGAKIVADAIHSSIQSIPVVDEKQHGSSTRKIDGITADQKNGLLNGLGIARMQTADGYSNVKIGMNGYNSKITKKYPNGQPNSMIARSIESGTSFRQKHPFIRPAVNKSRKAAEKKMAEVLDEETKKVMKQ